MRAYSKIHSSIDYKKTYSYFLTAYRNYRNICFRLDAIKFPHLELFNECPACPRRTEESKDRFYVTVDGNYRLCRKSTRGKEHNHQLPEISHFLIPSPKPKENGAILRDGCGILSEAGKTVAARYKNLDVSGVVMATCFTCGYIIYFKVL